MDLSKASKLEGWLTFSEAARQLGVTRQAMFGMVARDELTNVRSLGDRKPIYVVADAEVAELAVKRTAAQRLRAARRDAVSLRPGSGRVTVVDVLAE